MGSLLSIFRAKRDTKALLESIHNEIESIEDLKESVSKREKNCICLFFTAFVIIYTISVLVFYRFYLVVNYSKENIIENLLWLLPFIVSPFM
ncbi:unnamed protein product [Oppiella nova]|uniref:Uncharacterized protein n=1 Tax=Oppiella nova TaxID=334625 RepID=A0A7R9MRA7_9ACAR|nr:unnamed protein product [Oppiella nova]CAG2181697.1 unnamed protein product [Oppiella nova]